MPASPPPSNPPPEDSFDTPVVIYDGDCGFCRRWIARWRQLTGTLVHYVPYQDAADDYPDISKEAFQEAVHFVDADGSVYRGAAAAFKALSCAPRRAWIYRLYGSVPLFARASETLYRWIARNRKTASKLTRLLWGKHVEQPTFSIAGGVYIRLLGIVYLIAFASLRLQIEGLIGEHGILSAKQILEADSGWSREYWTLPVFSWLNLGDAALHLMCTGGIIASVLLIIGIFPVVFMAVNWGIYLSLLTLTVPFLNFQWDILLLETGFLAIFMTPLNLRHNLLVTFRPRRFILFLQRWLLFRLMFSAGAVKLLSGDPTWANLTALRYHFETQPLPTWTSWYMHQLPDFAHSASALFIFFAELLVPFFIFAPRRLRLFAFWVFVGLQLLIIGTGNFGFFNLLIIALSFMLIDDASWPRWIARRILGTSKVERRRGPRRLPAWIVLPVGGTVLLLSVMQLSITLGTRLPWPGPFQKLFTVSAPLHSVNRYGLFAVMTTTRPEIIVEGSEDGTTWKPYEFKWKPGDPMKRPSFVAPHMPRLDWQMWFAALGDYRRNPWFIYFLFGLLEGSPEILDLLETNPFPEGPPRYVRAMLYEYSFTDGRTRRETGAWWERRQLKLYCPVLSREGIEAIRGGNEDEASR